MSTAAASPAPSAVADPVADPVPAADRAAIERVMARQVDAWNAHDMHAFVADTMPDVDWINVVGMHWHGRMAVEQAHAALHRMPLFSHSRMVPGPVEMRPLARDVMMTVETSRIEGAGPTPGGGVYPASGAIMTMIFVRTPDGWRITHAHNTYIDAAAVANDPGRRAAS